MFGNVLKNGSVKNLNIKVSNITLSGYAGGLTGSITGINDGTISGCNVTIHNIDASQGYAPFGTGGITGLNRKTISDCHVTIAAAGRVITDGSGGGIAGCNGSDMQSFFSTIKDCTVTIETGGQIISEIVGGIAGLNGDDSTINKNCSVTGSGTIWGKRVDDIASSGIYAGGIVGSNESGSSVLCGRAEGVTIKVTSVDGDRTITAERETGNQPDADSQHPYAGTKIGYQKS